MLGALILTLSLYCGPFFLIWCKNNFINKRAHEIHQKAGKSFRAECERLGIQNDAEFSEVYSASFIRFDHKTERIAVYAGKTNRFTVLPYDEFSRINFLEKTSTIHYEARNQSVTNKVGGTYITTNYSSPGGVSTYVKEYTPEICAVSGKTGITLNSTGTLKRPEWRREVKKFISETEKVSGLVSDYNYCRKNKGIEQSFLEWAQQNKKLDQPPPPPPPPRDPRNIYPL